MKERIEYLRQQLSIHNYKYYVLAEPSISDYEFDQLLEELTKLEKENPQYFDLNSPTLKVGGAINKNFENFTHLYPMLSLGNTYSEDELKDFDDRIFKQLGHRDYEYICELKFDGLSISLHYENGILARAVTRGDGTKGDVVTDNVKTIKALNTKLIGEYLETLEVRGEIFMHRHAFDRLNQQRELEGESLFANPRNVASGTLKLQNSMDVAKRPLDIYLYHLIENKETIKTHFDSLTAMKNWGLKISEHSKKCNSIEAVFEFIKYWGKEKQHLSYDIDGVVIKINNYNQREELGFTAKSPRWAMAYKFKTEDACTKLLSIDYQVGRTGSITPVANLQPVLLLGTTVKRASLHNANEIERLDIRTGDFVYVEKGGEIIPKITGVNMEKRDQNLLPNTYITHCPECHTALVRADGEANHYCPNEDECPPQVVGKIQHFIFRKAMDISGLGEETIQLLYAQGLIKNIADLYDLKFDDVIRLERMAEKSAQNLIDGIKTSVDIPYQRVLFGLGIRYVGETVAKKLAAKFKTIELLKNATYEDLLSVDEIGVRIALSIVQYFKNQNHIDLIQRLKIAGLQFVNTAKELVLDSSMLAGKSVVISGIFSKYSRDEIKQMVEINGGKNASGITSKTDFVIVGENMGPAKLEKAIQLKISVLNEDDFLQMIGK
ncbi:MAG: NAD-dependent DNA ligase LigA [Bacteroidetes bacterium]|nr:NAD-dependent DNA ligase LigA [Bacteroidota bacterium]